MCQNDNSKPIKPINNLFIFFISLVNKDQPEKKSLSTSNIHNLWKYIDFEGVIL